MTESELIEAAWRAWVEYHEVKKGNMIFTLEWFRKAINCCPVDGGFLLVDSAREHYDGFRAGYAEAQQKQKEDAK